MSNQGEPAPSLRVALAGVGAAASVWPWVFRGKRGNFFAVRTRPQLRRETITVKDVEAGIVSAGGLYAIFQVGDRMARRIMPAGAEEIEQIYRFRTLASRPVIAALLVGVIAPSEELFWRGLVQESCARRFGRTAGAIAAAAAYGLVHLGSGNLTLTGAASVAGGYWGGQYALHPRLGPLLVSHILWDIWIFLVQPTPGGQRLA